MLFVTSARQLASAILTVVALAASSSSAADFVLSCPPIEGTKIVHCSLHITGGIRRGDQKKLTASMARYPKIDTLIVKLDSSGGDYLEAINIGQVLRRARAVVAVEGKARCFSSCVLLLAAGVARAPYGKVGVHRPVSTDTNPTDYEQAQREFRQLETITRAYLRDMNLPEDLFNAMATVPPHELKILSKSELRQYGLSIADPVDENINNAQWARRYKLSISEYLRRKALVEELCSQFISGLKWNECRESIFTGK